MHVLHGFGAAQWVVALLIVLLVCAVARDDRKADK
jgi:putative copper export protein